MAKQTPDSPKWLTVRTFLLRNVVMEVQQRVVKLSQSSQGQQLWDTAVKERVIHPDGSWPFQRWNAEH